MTNFGALTVEIGTGVWAPQQISTGNVTARSSSSGRQPNFTELSQTAPPIFGWGPSRCASAHILVMAAIWIGQAIIFSSCGFFLRLLSFSRRLFSAVAGWMSTILPYVMWPSANLEFKCAARGSLKIQDAKKSPKIRHLRTIAQLYWAVSSN